MEVIGTEFDVSQKDFQLNCDYHLKLKKQFLNKLSEIKKAGGEKAVAKHRSRNKFLARERIEKILDDGAAFLELSPMAANDVYEVDVPGAGIVTGIGQVQGVQCMFVANDATVKGGTYFPLTVKKHLRAQEIAMRNELPCIYLVDSGGAFLPKQDEVFPDKNHFGRIFFNQAQMSAKGIPQIAVVLGSCTAGGAYVPAMSDETIIVKDNGTIFLGGPPLVKAATGEDVTAEDLGGARVHTEVSGVADHFAENEDHAFVITRSIIENLNRDQPPGPKVYDEPYYNPSDLYGIIAEDTRRPFDIKEIIARLVDGSRFHEFKSRFGTTLVCGLAEIKGFKVGILANNGILFSESAQKGAHFIELCSQRNIPLVFLQNITGFMVGQKYESEGIAKHGAKLVTAVSTTSVPKFTVVVGGSFGAGNYGMCGRAYDPEFLWMWPNAKISVMGGEQAAGVLSTVKQQGLKARGQRPMKAKEQEEFERPILDKYAKEGSAYYSSARLWDDGILLPQETRDALAVGLLCASRREKRKTHFGVFRM